MLLLPNYTLGNNSIYNLVGSTTEWTDKQIRATDSARPSLNAWQEYSDLTTFGRLGDIAPLYNYNSTQGVGQIYTGNSADKVRGFIRGAGGIYGLDLSQAPSYTSPTLGFRCAK